MENRLTRKTVAQTAGARIRGLAFVAGATGRSRGLVRALVSALHIALPTPIVLPLPPND